MKLNIELFNHMEFLEPKMDAMVTEQNFARVQIDWTYVVTVKLPSDNKVHATVM